MNDGLEYGALYLHVPYCAKRCGYCDFVTEAVAADDARLDAFVDGLIRDIRAASRDGLLGRITTLYIGGGTPTFLGSRRLINLVYTLSLSLSLGPGTEFTVEANPESLTPALVRDLFALGVNRFSLGVQSLIDAELVALGRVHDARRARLAIEAARERTENVSIDLMCGIPLQSAASWQTSLVGALQSGAAHVSVYPLTIEEDTPFGRAVDAGRLALPDEDAQAQMMEQADETLGAAGLARYEVASFARPGFECRHNIAYWTGVPYLGLGKGAAGMRNRADGGRERLYEGAIVERLSAREAALEDVMLGMRMRRGVSLALLRWAASHAPALLGTFEELCALGLVVCESGANGDKDGAAGEPRYRPTHRGWLLGNELYGRIWATPE
jgi:oxygen-independent coproporphyrinogen-3 oxidase